MTEEDANWAMRFYHGGKWTLEEIQILRKRGQPIIERDWLFPVQEIEEIVLNHD